MSLILEALRKSEAERRRGQAPDLSVELPPTAQRRHRPTGAWLWPAVALMLAAILLLAWVLGTPAPSPVATDASPIEQPLDGEVPEQVVQTPTAVSTPPIESRAPAPSTLEPGNPASLVNTPALPPVPPSVSLEQPTTSPPTPRESSAPTTRPSSSLPATPQPLPTPMQTPPAATASASIPPTTTTTPAPATTREPVRLADLSADQRRQLPPLKISMHMWNPSPAQRFAIVDGKRVGEGDRIGDSVVEAITADAVVLAWNGQRLQVPIH